MCTYRMMLIKRIIVTSRDPPCDYEALLCIIAQLVKEGPQQDLEYKTTYYAAVGNVQPCIWNGYKK